MFDEYVLQSYQNYIWAKYQITNEKKINLDHDICGMIEKQNEVSCKPMYEIETQKQGART